MIPRGYSSAEKAEYEVWWAKNQDMLVTHFTAYRNRQQSKRDQGATVLDGPDQWIPRNKRAELRGIIARDAKCAYCERTPNEGGGYLEIEHFLPKETYPDKVFELDNLLPACKQCNTCKGAVTNRGGSEILNPYWEETLQAHLLMSLEDVRLSGISDLGKTTVAKLGGSLNVAKSLTRTGDGNGGNVFEEIRGALFQRQKIKKQVTRDLESYRHINQPGALKDILCNLLSRVSPSEPMTATWSSLLTQNTVFLNLVQKLRDLDAGAGEKVVELLEEKSFYSLCPRGDQKGMGHS